jgi:glycosyltransferase involved in cell wall biosynthesis
MKARVGKRVLMLLENGTYPQDPRVFLEASALTQAGYQVTVIAPAIPGQPHHEVLAGIGVYRYPPPPAVNGVLGYLWEYGYSMTAAFVISLLVFVRHGFDIVHAHNPPDTFVFIAAFYKLFGARFVFDHHDLSPEMYRARFSGGSRLIFRALVGLEQLSCRLADRVIATNESYKAVEMRRGCVPEGRITVVRNGPHLNRLRPVDPDPDLRQKGKTVIAYVGVIGFQDGVDYLLRALKHLIHDLRRTDFFCVLIGTGDALASLRLLAAELGLEEYVRLTGFISDAALLRYLSAADICVDPVPSNSFNDRSTMQKVMEYMALSKPIVAFDLPEHRFTAQQAALYVKPNDELEFARGLAQLMDDPERRQAMGSFGRQRVESALAWPYSVRALLEAYRAVLYDVEAGPPAVPDQSAPVKPTRRFGSWL